MQDEALNYFGGNELAASVWKSKYAAAGELTPEDMHLRMARELSPVMSRFDAKYTEGYVMGLLRDFSFIVPQGSVMASLGVTDKIASLSNCFVVPSPYDSYGGIMLVDEYLVQLMKRRGGVGTDISTLRPKGVPVKNAAKTSTGAASFMERYSTSTREVAQDGRRGALMLTIDGRHPDSTDFINAKQDRTKVTGANISVMLRDDFMQAVKDGEDYLQRWPCDISPELDSGVQLDQIPYGELVKGALGYYKKVRAKDVYKQVIHNAWDNAEPGQMFIDRMWDYSTDGVYPQYKVVTTNPCFAYDTPILTAEGYLPIGSLEGEEINFVNKDGNIVLGTVFKSGQKPIYEVKLSHKKTLRTTLDHKFMLVDGSVKEAQHLSKGDRLMPYFTINRQVNEFTNFGFLQGDGSLGRLSSEAHIGMEVYIGENDADMCALFGVVGPGKHYVRGYNEILKELGFSSAQLPERTLPPTIWSWEEQNVLMFLKGLWSANGSIISGARVSFKSSCKQLVEQLQALLSNFGISSYYTTNKAKEVAFSNGNYLCKESYDLNICRFESVLKFAELIGFVHKYKQDALEELIKSKAPKFSSAKVGNVVDVFDFTLYDDTHWGVVDGIITHNCGEIGMGAFDACRLVALNFLSFVSNPFTASASLNAGKLYDKSYDMQIMADAIVDLELGHIDRILAHIASSKEPENVKSRELELWQNIKRVAAAGRRTGCGFTALGDALAAMGIKYDSEQAVDRTREMVSIKMRAELNATIDLAEKFGPFTGWDPSIEKNKLFDFIAEEFPEEFARMQKVGRRNVSWSTVAPTGTVSLLTQTSSGLEPMFQPFYTRRRKINPSEEGARIDFTDQNGDNWMEYPVLEPQFKNWMLAQGVSDPENKTPSEIKALFEKSPWFGCCANDIDWKYRIALQAVIQKYTTHSLSSTINLPSDVTEETVAEIYLAAWEAGLKGVTVYRDGCRTGVLVTTTQEEFAEHNAPKRPKSLKAGLHHVSVMGDKYTIVVGTMNNKPYEVFFTPGSYKIGLEGFVVKKSRGHYSFVVNDVDIIENILVGVNAELDALTRLTSTALRHGASLDFVTEQLSKTTGAIVSPAKALARVLKRYQKIAASAVCDNCGSSELVMSEGCQSCKSCGNSKCS